MKKKKKKLMIKKAEEDHTVKTLINWRMNRQPSSYIKFKYNLKKRAFDKGILQVSSQHPSILMFEVSNSR